LFGVGDGPEDIGPWNAHETWKFAWPRSLEDYMAFGQTGWGDQYAYRIPDLQRGIETVHHLDHFLMETAANPVAETFEQFMADFADRAHRPDERVREARRQIGDLEPGNLAVFSPSPFLVGLERATHMMKMHARGAMVTSGDMMAQLGELANETRKVDRIETFQDDRGRQRIHVRWANQP
jgi:hypothetical protein